VAGAEGVSTFCSRDPLGFRVKGGNIMILKGLMFADSIPQAVMGAD